MHFVTAKGKRICQAVEPLGIAKPAAKKPGKNKMFYFGLLLLYSLPEDWTFLLCYVILPPDLSISHRAFYAFTCLKMLR